MSDHLTCNHCVWPHRTNAWLIVVAAALACVSARAAEDSGPCGSPYATKVGPYDYRTEQGQNKHIVENYHFTPLIEGLIKGESASLGADIGYTLHAFPNHHRALVAMMNLGIKLKTRQPPGASFTVECYFNRALRFRGDDAIARILYAKYLALDGRKDDARKQLKIADEFAGDNGFTHYNIGLSFLEMSDYSDALSQAHRALELGFMRPELKAQLIAAGKWIEPPAAPASASASASASAPAPAPDAAASQAAPSK